MEALFWVSALLAIYPYVLYPLVLLLLIAVYPRRKADLPETRYSVTVLIAAYNEADCIEATVRNKLAQDYPESLLQVVVVSDGSDDGTDEIVSALASETPRVTYLRQEPRAGKTSALNLGMQGIDSDLVIFADANSLYEAGATRELVRRFGEEQVGYVTGRMIYVDPKDEEATERTGAFMRYEHVLRRLETRIGSIAGVNGGIDVVRREAYVEMDVEDLPDFVLPLRVIEAGYTVKYEPAAILREQVPGSSADEFRMRARVALRGLWAMRKCAGLFNPLRFGLFSFQLLSHKLLRYLAFIPMLVAAISNWLLLESALYQVFAALQVLFFAGVVVAAMAPGFASRLPLVSHSHYFFLVNAAFALAFYRFLRGQKQILWQPRSG